jgi:hypothetical protein
MKYEPQPRPQRSTLNCSSSNSFAFYSFRTLTSHLKATVSSNSFAIKRFRTLSKIPGIGYPLSPIATVLRSPLPPQSHCRHSTRLLSMASRLFRTMDARNLFAFNRLRTLSIAMGVYTPLAHLRRALEEHRSSSGGACTPRARLFTFRTGSGW